MRRKHDLSVGEWAVLALLCERPAHGYAVSAELAPDGGLGRIWSVKQPVIYRTLTVLKSMELVEVAGVRPGDQAPQRTELRATAKAQRMVDDWLDTPEPRIRDLRPTLLLKLHLLHRSGRSPARLLTAQRRLLLDRANDLAAQPADAQPDALVRHWRQTMTEAAVRFVDEELARERTPAPS